VGDTITDDRVPAAEALPGFKPSIPVVWCGLYPIDATISRSCRDSLGKLRLNDASSLRTGTRPRWVLVSAAAFWACCTEIIQERLTRESTWS